MIRCGGRYKLKGGLPVVLHARKIDSVADAIRYRPYLIWSPNMYEITPETRDRFIVMKAIGRLTAAEYETLSRHFEQLAAAASGPLRVLLDWTELTGWDVEAEQDAFAMWAREWSDVERLAIVSGDKFIEDGLQIAKVLSKTAVRHFQPADAAEARVWLAV